MMRNLKCFLFVQLIVLLLIVSSLNVVAQQRPREFASARASVSLKKFDAAEQVLIFKRRKRNVAVFFSVISTALFRSVLLKEDRTFLPPNDNIKPDRFLRSAPALVVD